MITAVVRPETFEDIRQALAEIDVYLMTVTEVQGCGKQRGITEVYRGVEVEEGAGVRECRAGRDAGAPQQFLADEVRPLALHRTDAEVDARFAKVDRLQLRVAVGHVQQTHVSCTAAERRQVVEPGLGGRRIGVLVAFQSHAGDRGSGQDLEELALAQAHGVETVRDRW